MILIGENINASNKSVAEAITNRDEVFLMNLAKAQADAGVDYIDVNVGSGRGSTEGKGEVMGWLIETVRKATDKPLTIDSDDTEIIKAALDKYTEKKLIINSVTAEPSKLESIGPIAAERQAWLVALAMGDGGIPDTVEKRLEACDAIMKYVTGLGMPAEHILFDPLVLPIAVGPKQGLVTLQTIEQIKSRYPKAKTVMGLSNISFGLPQRKLVNRSFLLLASYAGLDGVILNPLDAKMMSIVRVANMLTGKDTSCREYLRAHRKGILVD